MGKSVFQLEKNRENGEIKKKSWSFTSVAATAVAYVTADNKEAKSFVATEHG